MSVAKPRKKQVKTVKDFEKLLFNYITGKLDLGLEFNANRIVTHSLGITGRPLMDYDAALDIHLVAGPRAITDNDGNVIVVGAGPGSLDSL